MSDGLRVERVPMPSLLPIGFDPRVDVPASLAAPSLTPAQAEAARKLGRAVRVRNAQDKALDAPFKDVLRARFEGSATGARASEASAGGRGEALGLVTNETSDTRSRQWSRFVARREAKTGRAVESIRLNVEAKRIKRLRTSVSHAARLIHFDAHCERSAQRWNLKFLTLTYADVDAWEAGHFTAFRKAMREWAARRGVRLRYVWVAELQERGAIHYHVVVWLPKGKYLPKADTQGWWPHGSTNIKTATSPIGYITKYASKTTADSLRGYPKGARISGHGGLPKEGRRHIRYWQAPMWVRDALGGKADIRKVTGGYMDAFTGEFLASPWKVVITPGGEVWAYRVEPQQELAA